jgi:hypothetical protein
MYTDTPPHTHPHTHTPPPPPHSHRTTSTINENFTLHTSIASPDFEGFDHVVVFQVHLPPSLRVAGLGVDTVARTVVATGVAIGRMAGRSGITSVRGRLTVGLVPCYVFCRYAEEKHSPTHVTYDWLQI